MTNPPVFPATTETKGMLGTAVSKASGGLTKRELFAIQVYVTLIALADSEFSTRGNTAGRAIKLADELLLKLAEEDDGKGK